MYRVNACTQTNAKYTVCAVTSKSLRPQAKTYLRQANYIFILSACLPSGKMLENDLKSICICSLWAFCEPACSSSLTLTLCISCCVARCRLLVHGRDVFQCIRCVYIWFAVNKWLHEPWWDTKMQKGSTALVFIIDCISLFPSSRGHYVFFISVHCYSVFSVSQKAIVIWCVILFKLAFKWCGVDSCIQCGKWSLKHSSGACLSPTLDRSNFSP